jgi:hypothetical protein
MLAYVKRSNAYRDRDERDAMTFRPLAPHRIQRAHC